jgi:hypothetical protein
MKKMEQIEMDRYRQQIISDIRKLVEKYRSIFEWDIPEINQNYSDKIILMEMQKALHDIEETLLG